MGSAGKTAGHRRDLTGRLAGLLWPDRCLLCGEVLYPWEREAGLCADCEDEVPWTGGTFCARCGKAVAEARDVYCSDCRSREHDFDAGRSLLVYTDAAARMIARYKFHNQRYYADWFAEQMAARLADDIRAMGADTLVPVPMYEKKRLARGFDQTLLLAEKLAEHTGLRVRRLLTRTKETRPMKDLGYEDRLLNVISALDIAPDAGPVPERVIVTDDIYTTGSTVDAFARVLKKAGAKKVYFLAAAAGRD